MRPAGAPRISCKDGVGRVSQAFDVQYASRMGLSTDNATPYTAFSMAARSSAMRSAWS